MRKKNGDTVIECTICGAPTCTIYSCSSPSPPPVTPSGSSPDGEFNGEVIAVDFETSTVTIDSEGILTTVTITTETAFNGSIAQSIAQILIGHVAEGEFLHSTNEIAWIGVDLPPGL